MSSTDRPDPPTPALLGEPRIFVEVLRPCGDGFLRSRKEISLTSWAQARFPGGLAELTINTALTEVLQYDRYVPPPEQRRDPPEDP